MSSTPAFSAWLDHFFASYFRHRPVNATFVGVHAYDDRLPDLSESGLDDARTDAEALLSALSSLPDEPLSEAQALDRTLARGFLEIQRWELSSGHFARGNPCLHTSEAAFGVIGLLRRPFAPLRQRLEATIARVAALPTLLDSAHPSVGRAPRAWIERAERECSGLRALLGDGGAEGDGRPGIEAFVAEAGGAGPALRAAAHRATDAVGRLERRLREARGRTHDRYACGAEALDLLLRHGHFLPIGADEIERYAWDQLAESEAYLREHARAFQASTWEEALAGLADLHPSAADYYTRHGELWAACRRAAESHRLVTWPDFPVRYLAPAALGAGGRAASVFPRLPLPGAPR